LLLTFDDRRALRLAVDAAARRRQEMAANGQAPRFEPGVHCKAHALSGRACRNWANETGWCGVHERSHNRAA
jgi:hypothetical protein